MVAGIDSLLGLLSRSTTVDPYGSYMQGQRNQANDKALLVNQGISQQNADTGTANAGTSAINAATAKANSEADIASKQQADAFTKQQEGLKRTFGIGIGAGTQPTQEQQDAMLSAGAKIAMDSGNPQAANALISITKLPFDKRPQAFAQLEQLGYKWQKSLTQPTGAGADGGQGGSITNEALFIKNKADAWKAKNGAEATGEQKAQWGLDHRVAVQQERANTYDKMSKIKIVDDPLRAGKIKAAEYAEAIKNEPLLHTLNAVGGETGKLKAQEIFALDEKAKGARKSLRSIDEMEAILDEGAITGMGAEFKLGFGKALQLVGINYAKDAVDNTQALVSTMANQTMELLSSGALGAGTGISDKDVEFAKKAAGGDISMTEESIRRVFDINRRALNNVVNRAKNERISAYKDILGMGAKPLMPTDGNNIDDTKPTPAPAAALDYLKANPGQLPYFVEQFGYTPEGY